MRWFVFSALIIVGACRAPQEVPEGRIDTKVHPEFDKFRPVAIAVTPSAAPNSALRVHVRREVYERLFDRRYSPFKLSVVDERVSSAGRFEPGNLAWDATLETEVSRWKPIRGTRYYAGDGRATLRHKTGEIIWSCAFTNYAFSVREEAGVKDTDASAEAIADLFIQRLPELPTAQG
ncbi:MAG: hypothetical protein OER88_02840 [Planctomycetota bacterium]|nr:hypothetical protein [Planctomycetota bacterium]